MKLTNVLFAEEMMPDPNGRLIVHAPFTNITVPFLPTNYSFTLSLMFRDLREVPQNVRVMLVDNDQSEIFNMDLPMNSIPQELHIPIEARGISLGLGFKNLILRKEGIYSLSIIWDQYTENYEIGVFKLPESQ